MVHVVAHCAAILHARLALDACSSLEFTAVIEVSAVQSDPSDVVKPSIAVRMGAVTF